MTTISEVAARAGVSRTTVSHVLNHADRVSVHLRERVMKAVEELKYTPNLQAQSLRTGRTKMVAVLIPDIRNAFYTELVKTVQTDLELASLDMLIFNTDVPGGHSMELAQEYLRHARQKRVDGLIVAEYALRGMHDALIDIDIPTVFVGNLPNQAVDSVRVDYENTCFEMGKYLAEQGHRRVAQITGPASYHEAMERARGFRQGLLSHGLDAHNILDWEGTFLAPSGMAGVDWLIEEHRSHMPSALFFGNHMMAIGGLARLFDVEIHVPKDLAVCVYGNLPQLDYVRPQLTRTGVHPAEQGHFAAQMLLDRLHRKFDGPPRLKILTGKFQKFDSA